MFIIMHPLLSHPTTTHERVSSVSKWHLKQKKCPQSCRWVATLSQPSLKHSIASRQYVGVVFDNSEIKNFNNIRAKFTHTKKITPYSAFSIGKQGQIEFQIQFQLSQILDYTCRISKHLSDLPQHFHVPVRFALVDYGTNSGHHLVR